MLEQTVEIDLFAADFRAHEFFQRRGDDIYCEMPVPPHIAVLGGEIEVPTIHGIAHLKIPAGTENGTIMRIRGKGAPSADGYGPGDLHVRVVVETPAKLDRRQKELLQQFGASCTEENYPQIKRIRRMADEFYARKAKLGK